MQSSLPILLLVAAATAWAGPAVVGFHPRLVFRPAAEGGTGRTFEKVRELHRTDGFFRTTFEHALKDCDTTRNPAAAAACWIVSGDDRFAASAAAMLERDEITQSGSGSYSNVWAFALAWDWLYHHPALAGPLRQRAADRIAARLDSELAHLDDTGMALWHGRNQAANGAMIAALALGVQLERATAHYTEALRALDYSEGWPEGPSYWIYNRALPYALAADCYLSATGLETAGDVAIRPAMRKIGLWTLYQYGPNGIFEPYGDSVGSLRLGDTGMWEASADYFARLSADPALMAGADLLRSRSPAPYGRRPIYWYAALAYDPALRPREGYDPDKPELWLRGHLPQTMLFGRSSLGVAFLRGAWGDPQELFASFKAGDLLAHHDHYQAGTFSIQWNGLLAPLTGVYGASPYTGAYRLGYAAQTVASNSLLVMAPGETSAALLAQPARAWTFLSGGQRVISPTGFDCVSVADFERRRNSGRLERATITSFESIAGEGDYIAADITAAYNSTRFSEPGSVAKVSLVTRQFLYLRREQAFVVFDRVETTDARFTPRFLLHAIAKPRMSGDAPPDDGIFETRASELEVPGEGASLRQVILLPAQPKTRLIGGPHYVGYVEPGDGPGVNLEPDPGKADYGAKPTGLWRVEVSPGRDGTSHRFLNVLIPVPKGAPDAIPQVNRLPTTEDAVALQVGREAVVFANSPAPLKRVVLDLISPGRAWLLDAVPNAEYRLGRVRIHASSEGVLVLDWPRGKHELRLIEGGKGR